MAELTAADTEADPANPFGAQVPRGEARHTDFPEDRLLKAGLSEDEVAQLRPLFEQAPADKQADFSTSVRQIEDEYVVAAAHAIIKAQTYTTEGKNIDVVLDEVSKDPELAVVALGAERARGSKARPTLISQLEEAVSNYEKQIAEQRDKVTAEGLDAKGLAESREAAEKAATQTSEPGEPTHAGHPAPPLAAVQEKGGEVVPAPEGDPDGKGNQAGK